MSRTPVSRTKYNAARPFRVIGGVSDSEVAMLQAARGPLAKVSLVSMWLQEFINREYLAGSMGNVASPIISRLHQFLSDGMVGYNQARKVAYVPFPFVHAQLTSFFVLIVVGFMPILMLAFINNAVFGFFLNILTVMCFTGLHEVSRMLECVVGSDIFRLLLVQSHMYCANYQCPETIPRSPESSRTPSTTSPTKSPSTTFTPSTTTRSSPCTAGTIPTRTGKCCPWRAPWSWTT